MQRQRSKHNQSLVKRKARVSGSHAKLEDSSTQQLGSLGSGGTPTCRALPGPAPQNTPGPTATGCTQEGSHHSETPQHCSRHELLNGKAILGAIEKVGQKIGTLYNFTTETAAAIVLPVAPSFSFGWLKKNVTTHTKICLKNRGVLFYREESSPRGSCGSTTTW